MVFCVSFMSAHFPGWEEYGKMQVRLRALSCLSQTADMR